MPTARSKQSETPKVKRRLSAQAFRDREKEEIKQNRTKDMEFLTNTNSNLDKNSLRALIDDMKLWKEKIQIPKPAETDVSPKRSFQNLDSSPRSRNNQALNLGFQTIEKVGSLENLSHNSHTPRAEDRNLIKIKEQASGQKKTAKKDPIIKPESVKQTDPHTDVRQLTVPVMKRQTTEHDNLTADNQEQPDFTKLNRPSKLLV